MRSVTLFPALAGTSLAIITGIAAPSQIAPGSTFKITLTTANYIQSVLDVSAVFGLYPRVYDDTLGNYLDSFYLGPNKSNILTNITLSATLPSSQPLGPTYLNGAMTSLYGASSSPTTLIYSLAITVANSTSTAENSTTNGVNACSTGSATTSSSVSFSSSPTTAPTGSGTIPLNTLVQAINTGLNSLLNDIIRSDTATAQDDYNTLETYVDQLSAQANPNGMSCNNTGSGSQLTETQAIQTIQEIQGMVSIVSQDVTNGDSAGSLTSSCAVQFDYLHSGLREYIFGSGQASGTGAKWLR